MSNHTDWDILGRSPKSLDENIRKGFYTRKGSEIEPLGDILTSIESHLKLERKYGVTTSIGRGHVKFDTGVANIWVTNLSPNQTYQKISRDPNGCPLDRMVSKDYQLGRILLHNYEGHRTIQVPLGKVGFDIYNSSSYLPTSSFDAERLRIGLSGQGWISLSSLQDALVSIGNTERKKQQKDDELRVKHEEERKQKAEDARVAAEKAAEIQRAKDESERKRLEEERKRIEAEQHARELAAQQEIRRIEEERDALDSQLREERERYAMAASFIRKQASLRLNPVLDTMQDEIKFSNVYNGVSTVIDGGPGTGKTTTLIQRLRLLISEDDLKDFMLYNPDCVISQKQFEVINKDDGDWIFFSPTELLKQYLKDNMNYEGLTSTATKVVEWNDHLRKILRDEYKLAGEKAPFRFRIRDHEGTVLIKSDEMDLVKDFISYYVDYLKDEIKKIADIDLSKFPSWKTFGMMVVKQCKQAESAKTTTDVIRLLISLNNLGTIQMPDQLKNGLQLSKEYNDSINRIALEQMVMLKRSETLYSQLLDWIDDDLYADEETEDDTEQELDDEDAEFTEDEEYTQDLENELLKRIKSLLRNLALATVEKVSLTPKQTELQELLGTEINTEPLKTLGELAFYSKRVHPVLRNMELFLMARIPKCYKKFRKEIAKNPNANIWNVDLLKAIVTKQSNRSLHPQEQALLLGFINNLILDIRKVSQSVFDNLKHKYSLAYKNCCKPVIGVDEATDYCLLDYYGISSLRHYDISAITLTGDGMQCLKANGIMDWESLRHPLLFPELDVKELTTSYRQSPELVKLAHSLYKSSMGRPAPYNCYLEQMNEAVPKPLWFESDDDTRKARWIVDRILEVKRSYGFVPSIAIFVNNREEAKELESSILEIDKLEEAGVKIADCSGGDKMSTNDTVRIFPLNSVKGMEFEVVFFYNIDEIESLVDRYLYVGLSRATFYMAVTANKLNVDRLEAIKKFFGRGNGQNNKLEDIRKLFVTKGDWRRIPK